MKDITLCQTAIDYNRRTCHELHTRARFPLEASRKLQFGLFHFVRLRHGWKITGIESLMSQLHTRLDTSLHGTESENLLNDLVFKEAGVNLMECHVKSDKALIAFADAMRVTNMLYVLPGDNLRPLLTKLQQKAPTDSTTEPSDEALKFLDKLPPDSQVDLLDALEEDTEEEQESQA